MHNHLDNDPTCALCRRFWPKVDKTDGCWLWMSATMRSGYGYFRVGPDLVRVHRLTLEWATGPLGDALALHRCDTRACCRPDHLFRGTTADNQRDMTTKGRGRVGERNGAHRLTADDVRYIRATYTPHVGGRQEAVRATLAARFGVSGQAIHRIVTRQTWGWLAD